MSSFHSSGSGGDTFEKLEVMGHELAGKVEQLLHEATVQHLVIKHDGTTVLEIPVGIGAVGAIIAPVLAAVAAVGAVVSHCTIEIVRHEAPTL
jgi:hypothetical protein